MIDFKPSYFILFIRQFQENLNFNLLAFYRYTGFVTRYGEQMSGPDYFYISGKSIHDVCILAASFGG